MCRQVTPWDFSPGGQDLDYIKADKLLAPATPIKVTRGQTTWSMSMLKKDKPAPDTPLGVPEHVFMHMCSCMCACVCMVEKDSLPARGQTVHAYVLCIQTNSPWHSCRSRAHKNGPIHSPKYSRSMVFALRMRSHTLHNFVKSVLQRSAVLCSCFATNLPKSYLPCSSPIDFAPDVFHADTFFCTVEASDATYKCPTKICMYT